VNSSFSSNILCGTVILDIVFLRIANIKHAVECIPKFPLKMSMKKPKAKEYIRKYHLGVLNGMIIKTIKYRYGLIYDANKISFNIYI